MSDPVHGPTPVAATLQDLTEALSAATTPDEVLDVLADVGRPTLGAQSINISLLDESGQTLRLVISRRSAPQVRIQFASVPVDAPYPARDALCTLEPVLIRSRQERDERYPSIKEIDVDRVAWAVLPLLFHGRPLGIVGWGWSTPQPFDAEQLELCRTLSDVAAAALQRAWRFDAEHQARTAAEDLAQRLGVLQTLTGQLAEATDLATVGDVVVGAGLRALGADAATIGLLEDSTFTALASVGIPEEQLPRWSTHDISRSEQARELLDRLTPIVITSLSDRDARYPSPTPRDDTFQASASLPLIAAGRPLGILAYGWRNPRGFDRHDLDYLTAIASHAATAIDRARLLARAEQTAETLQRALLPQVISELPGWDLATCYTPAIHGTQVGGDWYDAFRSTDGRIVLVLGDVAGKGIHAAAVMGAVRSAVRAYASLDPTPGTLLTRLDRYFSAFKPGEMVTCAVAVLDPGTGRVRYASAGQLPPLLAGPGSVRWLDSATSTPLGIPPHRPRPEAEITIEPGQVLLLYSDGLVERRDQDLTESLAQLVAPTAALATATDLGVAVDSLIQHFDAPTRVVDDIAVLALRRQG